MQKNTFILIVGLLGLTFLLLFIIVVIPPLLVDFDVLGAFLAGFVNPYSSGYSYDVFVTWAILATWIAYESKKFKYGWICLLLGVVPGVAVGFATYLILREKQLMSSDQELKR